MPSCSVSLLPFWRSAVNAPNLLTVSMPLAVVNVAELPLATSAFEPGESYRKAESVLLPRPVTVTWLRPGTSTVPEPLVVAMNVSTVIVLDPTVSVSAVEVPTNTPPPVEVKLALSVPPPDSSTETEA